MEEVRRLLRQRAQGDGGAAHAEIGVYAAVRDESSAEPMLELLLAQGANVNAADDSGYTALHFIAGSSSENARLEGAASPDEESILEYLIAHGADVNAVNWRGETPLHVAAWYSHLVVVQALIKHGARVGAKSRQGQRPLAMIGQGKGLGEKRLARTLVKSLLRRSSWAREADAEGNNLLHLAIYHARPYVAEAYLQRGAAAHAVNREGVTPLYYATTPTLGVSIAVCGRTFWNQHQVHDFERPLLNDPRAAVRLLLRSGARVNHMDREDGRAALHRVVAKSDLETARILIRAGASLHLKDIYGKTPLEMLNDMYGAEGARRVLKALRSQGPWVGPRS